MKWLRVSKRNPCVVCGRFDWDTYCPELNLACCMRVVSDRPAKNGGYLHTLNADHARPLPQPKPEPPAPKLNVTAIMAEWREQTKSDWLEKFGAQLGVSAVALASLGCAWAAPHRAWAWPMFDGWREPVGIRLRTVEGRKFAVTGSHQGIFLSDMPPQKELLIAEGPTDTAAALSLGLFAIGKPSCLGCEQYVNEFIRRSRVQRVIIVADADDPGQRGADKLQASLKLPSIVWTPPAKDVREAVRNGLTAQLVWTLTKDLLWRQA